MRTCVGLVFVVVCLVAGTKCAAIKELFECTAGSSYIREQCNLCYCIEKDDLVCTISKCSQTQNGGNKKCATGLMWKQDCNTCWCTNAGTICTNKICENFTN